MSENDERFLARWSRLKRTEASAQPAAPPPAVPSPADASAPLPPLPPIGELTIDSDYAGFFHPKVDEKLRRTALRKLFADPRFNVMDGLDVYTGDYSNDPLPAGMLAQLEQGKKILAWAREDTEKSAAEDAAAASPPAQITQPRTQIPPAEAPVGTGTVSDSHDVAPSAAPSRGS